MADANAISGRRKDPMPKAKRIPSAETRVVTMTAVLLIICAAVALLVPAPLILPAFSGVTLCAAAGAVLVAWLKKDPTDRREITLWDMAGAFALIGFAAGVLADVPQVLDLFGEFDGQR